LPIKNGGEIITKNNRITQNQESTTMHGPSEAGSRGSKTSLAMRIDHDCGTNNAEPSTAKARALAKPKYQCPQACDDCSHGKQHRHTTDCSRDPRSSTSARCSPRCLPVVVPAPDPRRCDDCAMYDVITVGYRGMCLKTQTVRKAFTSGRPCWIARTA
jgi:hypothetical protein